jgi:beta-galactosidase
MDFEWKFHKADIPTEEPRDHNSVYLKTKADCGRGPAAPDFYDLDWEEVNLPHDFVICEEPDPAEISSHGFIKRQNAWYRKAFRLDPEDLGKEVFLEFDGVATHCIVWVNGHLLHRNFNGYTSFKVDISDVMNVGNLPNVVSVYVDNSEYEGWWYEGGGIYRHVWLYKTSRVSVDLWGTWVKPVVKENGTWNVNIETTVLNDDDADCDASLCSEIIDGKGRLAGSCVSNCRFASRDKTVCVQSIEVRDPEIWSVNQPVLYVLNTYIRRGDEEIDCYSTNFGFRTFKFNSEKGFFLNGVGIKLKGVCCHEDQGNLGVAIPDTIREERIRMIKEMGCNAYRCAHNPPAPEILDLCDRYGILVMDENRWFNSSPQGLLHLENMVRRDRNHPSVILWSMANEEPLQGTNRGKRIMTSMKAFTRKLDDTRPVIMAMHSGLLTPNVATVTDVIGVNYNADIYDEIHEFHPDTPLLASEIGGKIDELNIMGDASGEDWKEVNIRPYMAGMFKWAGFGYRGEARAWPRLFSRSGIIDHDAVPKENYYFYKSMWSDSPFIKVFPHWNWDGREGELIEVRAYTNGDTVELLLNGKSMGRQKIDPYSRTKWNVPYKPGKLEAIAWKNEKKICEGVIETTGKAVRLRIEQNHSELVADGENVCLFTVSAIDSCDRLVPTAGNEIHFTVEGCGKLLAIGNSDAYDRSSPTSLRHKLYNGACHVYVRMMTKGGKLSIKTEAEGLDAAELNITVRDVERRPYVCSVPELDCLTFFAKLS